MKKQTKLTKKQKQRHYITALILTVGIVLVGVLFYTLKPSSAVQIQFEIEPETTTENDTISILYPGMLNATARCIVNGELVELKPTNVIESHNDTVYKIYIDFQFPDSATNRVVQLQFNVTITNATVCVNGFCSAEQLNSPIESVQIFAGTVEISLKSGTSVTILVETLIPTAADRRDDL